VPHIWSGYFGEEKIPCLCGDLSLVYSSPYTELRNTELIESASDSHLESNE